MIRIFLIILRDEFDMEEYEKELDAKIFTEINEKNTKNKE